MASKLTQEDLVLNIIVNGNTAKSEIGKVSRELVDSKKKLEAVNDEMKKLERNNQTGSVRYQELTAQADALNQSIAEQKQRLSQLNASLKLEEKSTTELTKAYRNLKIQRDMAEPHSDNWKALDEQMKAIRDRLKEINAGSEETGNFITNLTSKYTKLAGALIAGAAGLTAAWSGITRATDRYAEFDDKLSDVMKTTGLTKDAVKGLNAELEKIDTRTSQDDLLGLGRIAGKLGYTDVNEIAGFVRANNELVVALNEDLGGDVEETVNQVGKLIDIFKLKDIYSTEDAFRKVGSAINELGAAGTANEGYMVGLAGRLAGIAPLAGVSIDKIFGLAATLDQLKQSEEVAGTAISKLWINMAGDAKTYSKYAGMNVKEFQTLLEKDFMGAFLKVLQGVKNSSSGINELAATLGDLGQEGGHVVQVLGSLSNNIDMLQSSMSLSNQAMAEGTSLTKEYNVKNENAAAQLDKARKEVNKFWRELGEKLWPVLVSGNSLLTIFLRSLMVIINFIAEHYRIITMVATAYFAYNTVIALSNTNLAANIVLVKLKAAWDRIATAATLLWAAATELLAGRIVGANIALNLFFRTITVHPLGLLVAAISAIVAGLVLYGDNLRGIVKTHGVLENAMKKAQDNTINQTTQIDSLNRIMTDNTVAQNKRLAAMEQLKQIMPGVLDSYTQEELLIGKATRAIKEYSQALVLKSQIQAAGDELEELAKLERKIAKGELGFWTETYREIRKQIVGLPASTVFNAEDNLQSLKNIAQGRKLLTDSILANTEKLNSLTATKTGGNTVTGGTVTPEDKEAKKAAEKAAREAKKARLKELEEAKKAYQLQLQAAGLFQRDRKQMTSDELSKLADIEADYQQKTNEINRKYNHSQQETTKVALSELIKREAAQKKFREKLVDKSDPLLQQENEAYQERLKQAGLFGLKREEMTAEQIQSVEILENNHQANLNKIDADALAKRTDQVLEANKSLITDLKIQHIDELNSITSLSQAKEVLSEKLNAKELSKVTNLAQAKKLIRNQQELSEQEATRKHLEELLDILQETMRTGQLEGVNLSDALLSDEEKKALSKKIQELKLEIAALKGLDKTDEFKTDTKGKTDILGMTFDDWQNLFTNIGTSEEKLQRMFNAVTAGTDIWKQYNSFVAAGENAKLQQDEQANKKKKDNLDKRLKSGSISQEAYNAQIEKLDKDLEKKKSVIAYNQAKREKSVGLMTAIINTATGITKAFPNPVLMALVAAMGALQVATIIKTPLPVIEGREDGGYIDVRRKQDNKPFRAKNRPSMRGFIDKPTILVSEGGTEWVANNDLVNNPVTAPVISWLDSVQRNGNINPSMLSSVIQSSITGRATGGTFSGSTLNIPAPAPFVYDDSNMVAVITKLNNKLDNLKAEVVLLGKGGFVEQFEDLQRDQSNGSL
ncbi:phage tail tape measure protein [Sphingobacterium sp. HSC-15S19]|uniref:phage tail tape measure protein n=2 Tax=Sphingobacterium TaxID=28453 RepID=UPI003D1D72EA